MENYQITEWVHRFIREQVQPGDLCIDATMGNGGDTVLLSRLAGRSGHVLAFDIQQMALDHTARRLSEEQCPDNVELFLESHEHMGNHAKPGSVSCITFNLGYLPGGDHGKATCAESSVRAISAGLELLKKRGLMTICVYSGGDTGFSEKEAVLHAVRQLDAKKYLVIQSEYVNRPNHPPVPVLIIRL